MIKIGTTFYIRPLKKFVIVLSQDNINPHLELKNQYICFSGKFIYTTFLTLSIYKDYEVYDVF